jgi:aryl-alcohol dehydrogenase-like predicted oxidoreductase
LAGDLGTTVSKLALAWCLKNPNVSTVILGATQNTQLVDNLDALNVLPSLTEEVMLKIEEILGNKPKFPLYG